MLVYGKMLLYLRTSDVCHGAYVPLYIRHRDDPSGLSDCIYVFLRDTRLWTQAFLRVL